MMSINMNLQESIKKVLREETVLPLYIRRRVSMEELDGLVVDVKDLIDSNYDKTDAIYDAVRQFVATKKEFKFNHNTEQEYWDSYIEVEEPLVNYVKTNLQESIRRILREDISNRAQEKLNQVLKSQGVVSASKVVGGINNLVKKLGLYMDDLKTQEMLVKSFIYHTDIEDVNILHLEINRDRPDKVRIKIHFNTNDPASNMQSWLVRTLCDEMNKFFPFKTAPYWEPAFAGRGVTVILDSEQIVNGDDEDDYEY